MCLAKDRILTAKVFATEDQQIIFNDFIVALNFAHGPIKKEKTMV